MVFSKVSLLHQFLRGSPSPPQLAAFHPSISSSLTRLSPRRSGPAAAGVAGWVAGRGALLPLTDVRFAPALEGSGAGLTPTCSGISGGAAGGAAAARFHAVLGVLRRLRNSRFASLPSSRSFPRCAVSDEAKGEREEAGSYRAEGGKQGGKKRGKSDAWDPAPRPCARPPGVGGEDAGAARCAGRESGWAPG